MKSIYLLFFCSLFGVNSLSGQNQHHQLVLDFEGEQTNGFQADLTLGWSFRVNHPVKVRALAFFDHFESDDDGLSFDHQVRIWTDQFDAELIASTTITNESSITASSAANGRWLYRDIETVNLLPGDYVIGADDPDCANSSCDRYRLLAAVATTPEISFGEARSAAVPGPPLSPQPQLNGGYFGPSFMATPVILGDVNDDSVVDLLDVAAFVNALADGTYVIEADMNLDGQVNLLDVDQFVAVISGG